MAGVLKAVLLQVGYVVAVAGISAAVFLGARGGGPSGNVPLVIFLVLSAATAAFAGWVSLRGLHLGLTGALLGTLTVPSVVSAVVVKFAGSFPVSLHGPETADMRSFFLPLAAGWMLYQGLFISAGWFLTKKFFPPVASNLEGK